MSQGYRDLDIYKLSHKLAVEVFRVSLQLPRYEMYETGSQIRRSAKSVPANIVEGFSRRRYKSEYVRFLIFAHGSCNETIEHLELLCETGSLPKQANYADLKAEYEKLGAMLNRFIAAVNQNSPPITHNPQHRPGVSVKSPLDQLYGRNLRP